MEADFLYVLLRVSLAVRHHPGVSMHNNKVFASKFLALLGLLFFLPGVNQTKAAELSQTVSLVKYSKPASFTLSSKSDINLRNDYPVRLLNLKIFETETQKKVLEIKVFPAGESVNLAFSKAGRYGVCYYVNEEDSQNAERCIEMNLVKAREV